MARSWLKGRNDVKQDVNDGGLKVPKLTQDILWEIFEEVKHDPKKTSKLQPVVLVIGG